MRQNTTTMNSIEYLQKVLDRKLQATSTDFKRYLFGKIDWRDRLIGIKGPKGTGKSTLMLQHIKEAFPDTSEVLYASLDDLWFATHAFADVVEDYYAYGGRYLFLDEIHYLDSWQTVLKNLNDNYPGLYVAYTGSSMLKMEKGKGDLSRRLIEYTLKGLSFREYLKFEGIKDIPVIELNDLLKKHKSIAMDIISDGFKVLPAFVQYLKIGYYPFYKDIYEGYANRLQNVVNHILENDYAVIENVEQSTIKKAKKMFMILAEQVPQKPNMSELYRELDTDRNQGLKMLYTLEKAGLLSLLTDTPRKLSDLSRPEKIYLNNTNLMNAFTMQPNLGTMRELFFFNQLSQSHQVTYPPKGDFLIDGKYLFEVGGRKKSFDQIKDIPDSYLAVDETEVGFGNKIPLWMFGLLY